MCKVISHGLYLTTSSGHWDTLADLVSTTWTTTTIEHDIPKHPHNGSVTCSTSRHHVYLVQHCEDATKNLCIVFTSKRFALLKQI